MSGSTATRKANRERLLSGIPNDWRTAIHDATASDAFGDLADRLVEQWSRRDIEIYPPEHQVFPGPSTHATQ
jgi:uracil DNA glycosylase